MDPESGNDDPVVPVLDSGQILQQSDHNKVVESADSPMNNASDLQLANQPTKIVNGVVVSDDENEESPMEIESEDLMLETPFEILMKRRVQLTEIFTEFQNAITEGVEAFYVSKEWIERFLVAEYDKDDVDIHAKVGPVITTNDESSIRGKDDSFFSKDIFDLMIEWYGLKDENLIIKRQYTKYKSRYIIDLHPLNISPHVIGLNASSASRVARQRITNFELSSFKTVTQLRNSLCELFHLDHTDRDNRLWVIEYDDETPPPVIFSVSNIKHITSKKLINLKKANTKILTERNLPSGDYLLEVKQSNGCYLMDLNDQITIGTGTLGLNNLGNTCYMNSALQCLTHVPEMTDYFLYHYYQKEINKDNPLGFSGRVASAFGDLITNLFDTRHSSGHSSFSPRDFKYTIGHYNSTFSGYDQQDSQELVAFLLDAIHEDLNRVLKKPYVEKPELPPNKHNDKMEIKALAKMCFDAHKLRNDSVITDLFLGMYKSTLICPDCEYVSITFDPYNQLTLPLPIAKMWNHKIKILPEEGRPISLEVQLPQTSTYMDLKKYITSHTGIDENNLFGIEVHQHFTYKNYEDPNSDSRYLPLSSMIHKQDNVWFYEVVHDPEHDIILPVYNSMGDDNYRVNNLFSIPFFIALSEFERTDFGSILRKLLLRINQLCTAPIISELAAVKRGQYTKDDFPMIDDFMRLNNLQILSENDDLTDIISNAAPNLRFDDLFDIKMIDESSTPSYGYSRYNRNKSPEESKIWTPITHNGVVKRNNPSLITRLNLFSKAFYFYTDENAQKMLDREAERQRAADEAARIQQEAVTEDEDWNVVETNRESEDWDIIDEENDDETKVESKESLVSGNSEYFDACKGPSDDENASRAEGENAPDSKSDVDSMDVDEDITIEPLTGEADTMDSELSDEEEGEQNEGGASVEDEPMESMEPVDRYQFSLSKKSGLVIEWNADSFNNCFCDMAEDDFHSGRDTTVDLIAITNEELEKEKKLAMERAKRDITLYDCLDMFSKSEVLSHNDLWRCPKCKEEKQATKKIELWSTPDILIIHLKRFESSRSFSGKIDATIEFPIEDLDLKEHIAIENDEFNNDLAYDLFAVDNHYGGIGGGHYTAFVKNFVDSNWYYFNDSSVRPVTDPKESITGSAYLLFYKKRGVEPLGGEKMREMYNEIEKERAEIDNNSPAVQQYEELSMLTDSSESSVDLKQDGDDGNNDEDILPAPIGLSNMPSMENVTLKSSDTISICESDDGLKRRKVEIFSPAVRNNGLRDVDSDIDDI